MRRCNFAGTPALYFAVDAVNKNMTRVLVKKLLPPWKRRRGKEELIRGLHSFHAPPPSMEINFPFNALLFCRRADNRASVIERSADEKINHRLRDWV